MKTTKSILAAAAWLWAAHGALAAVSAEEAAQLGKSLTPTGAERAGNKDGTIPAWSPGWKGPDYPKNGGRYPDPYPGEKPLFFIDGKNMDQHADKLSEGTKVLLKRFPDYRLAVYTSHRTFEMPGFVEANTLKNALKAKTAQDGNAVVDALGGIPFPIPKTGNEVIWNHLYRYAGPPSVTDFEGLLWDANGNRVLAYGMSAYNEAPVYEDPDEVTDTYQVRLTVHERPARIVGDRNLSIMKTEPGANGNIMRYNYTQGQRRVRLAPEAAFDSPSTAVAGVHFFDEQSLWEGSMERFNFKLVGKKEMYIPYNTNKFNFLPIDEAFGPKHPKSEALRWELHRVWQVEAVLKPGMRHANSKKVFFVDEDRWEVSLYDSYDQAGNFFKTGYTIPLHDWANKAGGVNPVVFFDLVKGQYLAAQHMGNSKGVFRVARWPANKLTPQSLAGTGIR